MRDKESDLSGKKHLFLVPLITSFHLADLVLKERGEKFLIRSSESTRRSVKMECFSSDIPIRTLGRTNAFAFWLWSLSFPLLSLAFASNGFFETFFLLFASFLL